MAGSLPTSGAYSSTSSFRHSTPPSLAGLASGWCCHLEQKHGVTFEDAMHVFADPHALFQQDRSDEQGEMRWQAVGQAGGVLVLLVAHTVREALAAQPDAAIDLTEVSELPESFWKNAVPNPFYRPVKQQLTVRLDADVVAWLKQQGKGYQTRLNQVLREAMVGANRA